MALRGRGMGADTLGRYGGREDPIVAGRTERINHWVTEVGDVETFVTPPSSAGFARTIDTLALGTSWVIRLFLLAYGEGPVVGYSNNDANR